MLNPADLPDDMDCAEGDAGRRPRRAISVNKSVLCGWNSWLQPSNRRCSGANPRRLDPDQFELALEDIETAIAAIHAEDEAQLIRPRRDPAKPRECQPWVFAQASAAR